MTAESDKLIEDNKYSIETNNNFKVLDEENIQTAISEQKVVAKHNNSDCKHPKVDNYNYKDAFKDFLQNFKEESCDDPKYQAVASRMMQNQYNMFHVHLKDIRKFNSNLGGFVAEQHKNLDLDFTEIIKNFIEDLGLGTLMHGLYFNLNRTNKN